MLKDMCFKDSIVIIFCLVAVVRADVSHLSDYSLTPSSQVAYYHYPAPSRGVPRLQIPYASHSQQVRPSTYHQSQVTSPSQPFVQSQFTAPALDQAAFSQVLSKQGYAYGGSASVPQNLATGRSSSGVQSSAAITRLPSSSSESNSVNVKLPVPFGVSPLNIAQLPLQSGAPYDSLHRGLTSYGTLHPQRRR